MPLPELSQLPQPVGGGGSSVGSAGGHASPSSAWPSQLSSRSLQYSGAPLKTSGLPSSQSSALVELLSGCSQPLISVPGSPWPSRSRSANQLSGPMAPGSSVSPLQSLSAPSHSSTPRELMSGFWSSQSQ